MINELQIKILHQLLAGVVNRYGVLSLDRLDYSDLSIQLNNLSKEEIIKTIQQIQDRRFIVSNNMIFTTQKKVDELSGILSSYMEFPEPKDVKAEDVEAWIDLDNLPSTTELNDLKAYCIEKSNLEDKVERSYRFNFIFYVSANGITMNDYNQLSPFIADFFQIEETEELTKLSISALENQVSWMNAGNTSKNFLKGGWYSTVADKMDENVTTIYSLHRFCLAAANYYGYLEMKDAFRIYKSMEKETVDRTEFTKFCELSGEYFPIYSISGAIVSAFLFEKDVLNYWHDKTKKDFIEESNGERSEEDAIYLSTLLLIKKQSGKKFSVPTETEFKNYIYDSYVKETKPYIELVELVKSQKENFDVIQFNRTFNFYANLVCENEIRRKSDAIKKLGLNLLKDEELKRANSLLENAFELVPNWTLRGFSVKESKQN